MAHADAMRDVLEPVLLRAGLTLEDVTVTPAGRRRVARVVVDRLVDGGDGPLEPDEPATDPVDPLTLDEVAEASRVVSEALDASGAMGSQSYTLEVTSPGVDRPLTLPRHFRRNVGRLVRLELVDGEVTGRITQVDRDGVQVEVPATRATPRLTRALAFEDVVRARVQVEFTRPGTPGDAGALSRVTDADDPLDGTEEI